MTWSTHLMGGLSALWLLELLPLELLPLAPQPGIGTDNIGAFAGAAALGSLLPDLDAAHSKIKHLSFSGIKPFYLPSQLIFHAFGHRTLLHSWRGLAGLSLLALLTTPFLDWRIALAIVLGYASHLALDACNPSGIPLRYPDCKRFHLLPKPWRIVTGSPPEELFFAALALLSLWYLLLNRPVL